VWFTKTIAWCSAGIPKHCTKRIFDSYPSTRYRAVIKYRQLTDNFSAVNERSSRKRVASMNCLNLQVVYYLEPESRSFPAGSNIGYESTLPECLEGWSQLEA